MGVMDDFTRKAAEDLPRLQAEADERHAEKVEVLIERGVYDPDRDHRGSPGESGEVLPSTPTAAELEVRRREALGAEENVVSNLRSNAERASEITGRLLDRAEAVSDRDLPNTLRAVADVQSKSVDGLLKMTGRDREQAADDMVGVMRSLAAKGLLKINVNLDVGESG